MLERIKAVLGFGRKKDNKKKTTRISAVKAPEFEIPDMPENIDMDGMNRSVPSFQELKFPNRALCPSPTPARFDDTPTPTYVSTPSPVWEPPASSRSYSDDTPSHSSSSGNHCDSSSSSSSSYDSGSSYSSSCDSGSSSSSSSDSGSYGGGCD